jgi:hypothetical protein
MNLKQLRIIRRDLEQIRANPVGRRSRELEGLATKLGREQFPRGKEPTWIRKRDPALSPPLSIPNHGKDLSTGTCRSIANALLDDCDEWEQFIQQNGATP